MNNTLINNEVRKPDLRGFVFLFRFYIVIHRSIDYLTSGRLRGDLTK